MGSSRFDVLWGKRGAVVKLAEIFEGGTIAKGEVGSGRRRRAGGVGRRVVGRGNVAALRARRVGLMQRVWLV